MKRFFLILFLILHASGLLAVLAVCLVAASDSVSYYGAEPFAFTYSRSSAAFLCGSFAAAHLYLLATGRLLYLPVLFFYPLCFLLGLVTEVVTRGSAKDWPPASATGAMWANLTGYSAVAALAVICVISCYWSFTRNSCITARHHVQGG